MASPAPGAVAPAAFPPLPRPGAAPAPPRPPPDAAGFMRLREEVLAGLPDALQRSQALRRRYLDLVAATGAAHTDNLQDPHAWAVYVHYTRFLARLLPDREAVIVDWGGLYGHVTQLLRGLGYRRAMNYLLHRPAHHDRFQEVLGTPTVFGQHPNVLALPDAGVDAFVSSGVLEHVREDGVGREDLVLQEVRRVLRPGGILAVWNLPRVLAPADLLGKARGTWHHEFRYWRRDVEALVAGAGLELLHLEVHGASPVGLAAKRLGGEAGAARAFALDLRTAGRWPFRWMAQNFAFVARRPPP